MNSRLQQFLTAENISQAQFSSTIGVSRAAVTHVISGRSKPSFEFLLSIGKHYPKLSLDWLISGKGKMYVQTPASSQIFNSQSLFQESESPAGPVQHIDIQQKTIAKPPVPAPAPKATAKITKIMVFFDDGSYREIE